MAEPRRDPSVPLPVTVRYPDGGERVEYAVNLSEGGACLHLPEPVKEGTYLELAFAVPDDGPAVRTRAWVVWCMRPEQRAEDCRFWEVGLRFDETLPGEARERLRRWVRYV